MIEQIIEKFEKKLEDRVEKGGFTYLYEGRDELDREEIENFIRSEFSSYNKQLLDGIESEIKEKLQKRSPLDSKLPLDFKLGYNESTHVVLSTLNKYRV